MNLKNPAHLLVILMSLLLSGYTIYKAVFSSFTHDECYTWLHYVNLPVRDIIFFTSDPSPNNHVLNTLLMKASQALFGNHEWSLRLPNLLAYMLFLIYSVCWLREAKNNMLLVSGMMVFHANAYLLDFFSLARGYGLSVSFIFISIFYLRRYFSASRLSDAWLSLLAGALAVWSNFTGLHYYAALLTVYLIFSAGDFLAEKTSLPIKIKKLLYRIIPVTAVTFVLYMLIAGPLKIISTGSLVGSSDGFYQDTIRSIVFYSFMYDRYGLNLVSRFSFFTIAFIIVSSCIYGYHLVKMKFSPSQSPNLLLVMLIVFTAFSTQLYHYFSGTPFLQNRTALLFIVLFNSCYLLLYQFLTDRLVKKNMHIVHVLFLIYPIFLVMMFTYNFRPHYYLDWKYDCKTKEMLTELKKDIAKHDAGKRISLGISWVYEPAINYYLHTKRLYWLKPVSRDGYAGSFDYYYVTDDPGFIESRKLEVVAVFPESSSMLARRPDQQ